MLLVGSEALQVGPPRRSLLSCSWLFTFGYLPRRIWWTRMICCMPPGQGNNVTSLMNVSASSLCYHWQARGRAYVRSRISFTLSTHDQIQTSSSSGNFRINGTGELSFFLLLVDTLDGKSGNTMPRAEQSIRAVTSGFYCMNH